MELLRELLRRYISRTSKDPRIWYANAMNLFTTSSQGLRESKKMKTMLLFGMEQAWITIVAFSHL